jgi:hypothetical protein
MSVIDSEPVLSRKCGTCTLCCTLVPVLEIRKAANTRCTHQFSGGCRIYADRPLSCFAWNCSWLVDESTSRLRRPDRAHYVIDSVPDKVVVQDQVTLEENVAHVTVIWCDPNYPLAHRDPALRAWIQERQCLVLVRNGNRSATALVPPALTGGEWMEFPAQLDTEKREDLKWAVEDNPS